MVNAQAHPALGHVLTLTDSLIREGKMWDLIIPKSNNEHQANFFWIPAFAGMTDWVAIYYKSHPDLLSPDQHQPTYFHPAVAYKNNSHVRYDKRYHHAV